MTPPDLPGPSAPRPPDASVPPHGGPGATAPGTPSGIGGLPGFGDGPGEPGEPAAPGEGGQGHRRPRKRRWPRVLIAIGVFFALVVAGLGGLVWQRQSSYN